MLWFWRKKEKTSSSKRPEFKDFFSPKVQDPQGDAKWMFLKEKFKDIGKEYLTSTAVEEEKRRTFSNLEELLTQANIGPKEKLEVFRVLEAGEILSSFLDGIPQLPVSLKQSIHRQYGTLEKLKSTSWEDLLKVPEITDDLATVIWEAIGKEGETKAATIPALVDASEATVEVRCPDCENIMKVPLGIAFWNCSFCNTSLYLYGGEAVFHYMLNATFDDEMAKSAIYRWMSSSELPSDLAVKATILEVEKIYFPLWYIKVRKGDREFVSIHPAASTSIGEMNKLELLEGNLTLFSQEKIEGFTLKLPETFYDVLQVWLKNVDMSEEDIKLKHLVHIPWYIFKYEYEGEIYRAIVEGSSGKVLTSVTPIKKSDIFTEAFIVILGLILLAEGLIIKSPLVGTYTMFATSVAFGCLLYYTLINEEANR